MSIKSFIDALDYLTHSENPHIMMWILIIYFFVYLACDLLRTQELIYFDGDQHYSDRKPGSAQVSCQVIFLNIGSLPVHSYHSDHTKRYLIDPTFQAPNPTEILLRYESLK